MKKHIACILMLAVLASLLPLAGLADTVRLTTSDFYGTDTFYMNESATMTDGHVYVSWTDQDNKGPYVVGYLCEDDTAAEQTLLAAKNDSVEDSTTNAKSFTLDGLTPGHKYTVVVYNSENDYAYMTVAVPQPAEFVDGKLNASQVRVRTEPKRYSLSSGSIQDIDRLTAGEIEMNSETFLYGVRYEINLPELARDRDYFVQIDMTGPNGYTKLVHSSQKVFSTGLGWSYYLRFIGYDFFDNMYSENGSVPTGTYTIRLFFNGMLANVKEITVR